MTTTFQNAPLVEIIAEVRWSDPSAVSAPGTPFGISMPGTVANDDFLMRFGGLAYASGFKQSERLIPPGFPVPVGQVSHRYRPADDHPDELTKSAMWQIGPGVFAANGVPPYKSWTEFRPLVEKGIAALVETRPEAVRSSPFSHVSLRYIDAFTERFTEGISAEAFLSEKLGLGFSIPDVFRREIREGGAIEQALQFSLPLRSGSTLTLNVSPGAGPDGPALLMTTAIAFDAPIEPDVQQIMEKLDIARGTIHAAFEEMTQPLRHLMQPNGV